MNTEEDRKRAIQELAASDLQALRVTAEAATPGPWERRLYDGVRDSKSRIVKVIEPPNEYGYDRVVSMADYLTRENAEHIATFDPPTALALLDRLEAAEKVIADALDIIRDRDGDPAGRIERLLSAENALSAYTKGTDRD